MRDCGSIAFVALNNETRGNATTGRPEMVPYSIANRSSNDPSEGDAELN